MSKRLWYVVAAVALLAALIWAAVEFSREEEPKNVTTIRIGSHTTMLSAALDVAAAKGYFDRQGIRVVLDHQESSKATMPALISGALVIAIGSNSAGSFNHLSSGKIQILADAARVTPRLLVRKDLRDRISKISDLRNLSIRVPREGSASHFALHRILSTHRIPDSEVTLSFLDEQIATAELKRGGLDAGIINEPYASEAISLGIAVEPWPREIEGIFGETGVQHMVLFVNKEYADSHPGTVVKFLAAYQKGIRDYLQARENPKSRPDILQIIAGYTGAKADTIIKAEWPWVSPDGQPDLVALGDSQKFFLEAGLLERPSDLTTWSAPPP